MSTEPLDMRAGADTALARVVQGENLSRQDMQEHMPPDTHFGVHMITMGAEEDFGANRNGDSASRAALEKYHPTFEKFGCVFREHKNKCQKTEGIGQVKLARYNPKMKRGELITWVEKDKAPDMYKAAKDGKEDVIQSGRAARITAQRGHRSAIAAQLTHSYGSGLGDMTYLVEVADLVDDVALAA